MKLASVRVIVPRKLAIGFAVATAMASALSFGASDNVSADSHTTAAEEPPSVIPARMYFRVESKVFTEKATQPSSENLTLFVINSGNQYQNLAYDFLSSPSEITVIDTRGQHTLRKEAGRYVASAVEDVRITLLDPTRKLRTELNLGDLQKFSEQLRSRAARQANPLLKFAADPKFSESSEQNDAGETCMRFTSPLLTYRVWLTSDVPENADFDRYFDFCDFSAQLNSMMHPGTLPPFPRMKVDADLRLKAGRPPARVEVTISDDAKGGKPIALRSEHHFLAQLTAEDQKRIDEANEDLKTFKQVSWEEYLRPIQQAKR
jgi:hypothetical protein